MAIHAVFKHEDGYKFEQVYAGKNPKRSFLASVRRGKNVEFLNAIDTERHVVIYPNTLPDYIRNP